MTMPDATKTIKTDEVVHAELEILKQKHNVDTFNAALRHELGIVPSIESGLDNLTAYLIPEFQETVRDIVEILSAPALVQHVSEESATTYTAADSTYLQFVGDDTSRVLFEIAIDELGFDVYYRTNKGKMEKVASGQQQENGLHEYGVGGKTADHIEKKRLLQQIRQKADGARARWLEN